MLASIRLYSVMGDWMNFANEINIFRTHKLFNDLYIMVKAQKILYMYFVLFFLRKKKPIKLNALFPRPLRYT